MEPKSGVYKGKIRQTKILHPWAIVGPFYGEIMETIGLKTPGIYSAQFWSNNFSICLWKNPKTSFRWFRDFRTRVRASKPTICIFWDPGKPKENQENPWNISKIFQISKSGKTKVFESSGMQSIFKALESTGAGKSHRFVILKSLNMRSISIKQYEMGIR